MIDLNESTISWSNIFFYQNEANPSDWNSEAVGDVMSIMIAQQVFVRSWSNVIET